MTFDVLAPSTVIEQKALLEASAGTGKTFAIEHIVTRLLIENETITLPQILLVTFTRASTRELRVRLRKNLESVLQAIKDKKALFPYLENVSENAEERLESAIFSFDEAQVFTLHGFCYQKLLQYGFECQEILNSKEPLDGKDFRKVRGFLRLFLQGIGPEHLHKKELTLLFSNYRTVDTLYEAIYHEVKGPEKQVDTHIDLFHELKEMLQSYSFEAITKEKLYEDFLQLSTYFKKVKDSFFSFEEEVEYLAAFLQEQTLASFSTYISTDMRLFEFLSPENQKKRVKGMESCSLHFPNLFQEIKPAFSQVIEKFKNPSRILRLVAQICRNPLNQFLSDEEILDPDDLLQKMLKALDKSTFRCKIQQSYQAAIIDEFQDTDHLQWEIFSRLFLSEKEFQTFYLVGDPKQAIYRFRKADIYTYLKASQQIQNTLHLDTNYRSHQSLISSLNTLFSHKSDWLLLPDMNKRLHYREVKGVIECDHNDPSLQFVVVSQPLNRGSWPSKDIEYNFFFPFIYREINAYAGTFSDWAILVRDRFQADRLKNYLLERGVAVTSRSRRLIASSYLFEPLKRIVDATLHPFDEMKLKAAMMTPFIACTNQMALNTEESFVAEITEQLLLLQTVLEHNVSQFFSKLLDCEFFGKTVSANLATFDLFHECRELFVFFLQKIEEQNLAKEELLALFDQIEEEGIEKSSSSAENGVEIITIHSSKGLEFTNVIALGLINRTPEPKEDIEELDAEKFRQLYVALTRAKKRLYIPMLIDSNYSPIKRGTASPMELFMAHLISGASPYELLEKEYYGDLIHLLQKIKGEEKAKIVELNEPLKVISAMENFTTVDLTPPEPFKKVYSYRQKLSFSSISRKKEHAHKKEQEEGALPAGMKTGLVLHRILEEILKSPNREEALIELVQKETASTELEDHRDLIQEITRRALTSSLCDVKPELILANIPFDELQVEMEFFFQMGEDLFYKGFIDLLFMYEGKYYIVDWKTNELNGDYSLDSLEKEVKSHEYDLQAIIYTAALKKHLGAISTKPFEELFGGAFTIFLRGLIYQEGIYHFDTNELLSRIEELPQFSERAFLKSFN